MRMKFIAVAVIGMALAIGNVSAQTITIAKENRTLEVSGVGTASALPEIAKVHVGFITYGATLAEGYKSASDLSSTIMKALNGAGAAKTDIESQGQSINALNEYELKNLPAALRGMKYRVTQSWTVSSTPEQVAKVLDSAVQAGANQSGQIEWSMKDSTSLERQALSKATARTRALAEEMATGMGVKLGPLVYVTTEGQGQPVMPMARAYSMAAKVADASAPLEIEAQRIERSVTVRAVFSIE